MHDGRAQLLPWTADQATESWDFSKSNQVLQGVAENV